MQGRHIFSGRDADVALRNEATEVHILSLYSEAIVCDFRGGVILYTLTTQVNALLLEFVLKKQKTWLEKYCNRDYINPCFCLPYKMSRDPRNTFLRFRKELLEKHKICS